MRFKLLNIIILGLILVVTACSPEPSPPISALDSPLSPVDTSQTVDVQPFQFDKPIAIGATHVTGSGPADTPIMIIDISFNGAVLGMGQINQNGQFDISLNEPLPIDHRIGLALGNLEGTGWITHDFQDSAFYGPEALSVPQVGFFYDTYMIRE